MNATDLRLCFEQLGAGLSDADALAICELAERIRAGQTAVGSEGLSFDTVLEPRLTHQNDALEELDQPALGTVGGVVAMLRAVAAETGEASLVPRSYVPIATGDETVLLLGVDGPRAGHLYAFTTEGQNQAVTAHQDVEDLGPLPVILGATPLASTTGRTVSIVTSSSELQARLTELLREPHQRVELRVTGAEPFPELNAELLQAAPESLERLVFDSLDWHFTLALQRTEGAWSSAQCTIGPQPGHRKAAFVKPLVQLLRGLPPLKSARFEIADGLGRVVKNALAQVPAAASWELDLRGG